MIDIYFELNYGKLYEKIENGKCEEYEYNCEYGSIRHMFIKREIPFTIEDKKYFDLITPYGYGGPIIANCVAGKEEQLVKEFESSFQKFCTQNNIVCEFVRFHPLFNNAKDFLNVYNVELIRKTVGTNIRDFDDPIESEFTKGTRKLIRKLLNMGLSYKVTKCPNNLENFRNIYYSTMDRNEATNYYYFGDEYFTNCVNYFKNNIILLEVIFEDKIIASGLYFIYNKIIHAHLSGTLKEFLHLSPAYIIKYATAQWAIENEFELIHYGGGTTNSVDDNLYQFKKKFGQQTEFDFKIGKKVWNQNIYEKLCHITDTFNETNYFPAYRKLRI